MESKSMGTINRNSSQLLIGMSPDSELCLCVIRKLKTGNSKNLNANPDFYLTDRDRTCAMNILALLPPFVSFKPVMTTAFQQHANVEIASSLQGCSQLHSEQYKKFLILQNRYHNTNNHQQFNRKKLKTINLVFNFKWSN